MAQRGDMSPTTACRIAALIVSDAQQLEEKAQQQGVTAFLGRAVHRERPNERFLQSTLRNVASSNRRVQEKEMWAAWEAQKQHGGDRLRHDAGNRPSAAELGSSRHHSGARHRHSSKGHDSSRQGTKPSSQQLAEPPWRSRSSARTGRSSSEAGLPKTMHRKHKRRRSRSASRNCSSQSRSPSRTPSGGHHAFNQQQQPPGSSGAAAAQVVSTATYICGSRSTNSSGFHSGDDELVQWLSSSKVVRGRGSVGPAAGTTGPYPQAPADPAKLQRVQHSKVLGPQRPLWLAKDTQEVCMVPSAGFFRGVLREQDIVPAGSRVGNKRGSHKDSAGSEEGSGSGSDTGNSHGSKRKSSRKRSNRSRSRDGKSRRKKLKKDREARKHKKSKSRHRRSNAISC
eukprot:GHRR01004200.1.p1 GENE.GHRR01004200.1~~GHRR01004200.1.p1  ORF type:complete len:397 (+),score=155.94 GHRR01004200.1:356-1546(+)